jgi:hypothetical protein
MKLVINVGIWNIVAHIAFKFYPGASETFSTASTFRMSDVFFGFAPSFVRHRFSVSADWSSTPKTFA